MQEVESGKGIRAPAPGGESMTWEGFMAVLEGEEGEQQEAQKEQDDKEGEQQYPGDKRDAQQEQEEEVKVGEEVTQEERQGEKRQKHFAIPSARKRRRSR
jgi:pyruvate/2-oxoglutarate dehydrogenase complex dihydrolipoamide acyltransferase (E2) component